MAIAGVGSVSPPVNVFVASGASSANNVSCVGDGSCVGGGSAASGVSAASDGSTASGAFSAVNPREPSMNRATIHMKAISSNQFFVLFTDTPQS